MTDKQIIIDGVDVSECAYFRKDDPCKNTCQHFCTPCEWVEIQNCMYKYAKRKEQECEELKNCGNPSEIGLLSIENKKLKQALTEIKQIAEKDFNHTCWQTYEKQLKQILQKISEVLDVR